MELRRIVHCVDSCRVLAPAPNTLRLGTAMAALTTTNTVQAHHRQSAAQAGSD